MLARAHVSGSGQLRSHMERNTTTHGACTRHTLLLLRVSRRPVATKCAGSVRIIKEYCCFLFRRKKKEYTLKSAPERHNNFFGMIILKGNTIQSISVWRHAALQQPRTRTQTPPHINFSVYQKYQLGPSADAHFRKKKKGAMTNHKMRWCTPSHPPPQHRATKYT